MFLILWLLHRSNYYTSKHLFCFLSFHPEKCPHQRHKCFITPLSVHSSCEAGTINPAFNVIDIGFAFNLFHYTDHEIRNVPILIDLDFQTQGATMRWKELKRREPCSHEITWEREGGGCDLTKPQLLQVHFLESCFLFRGKLPCTFLLSEYCLKGGGELSRLSIHGYVVNTARLFMSKIEFLSLLPKPIFQMWTPELSL